ncbi:RHS repeat-associated core domain-containing protein, partial [Kaistella sp.]|uniref:RHS repeat-associated core domain-containing protein n=1 Tax=Kaistella sp. TaxID=2782235 RepID=UPI003C484801
YDFKNKRYIYQYKDHLGNVRVNYTKTPDGSAAALNYNTYYAFGMNHLNPSNDSMYNPLGAPYNYKYNGKELQETGMYDYGWRMYMPDIARWNGMDQLSEKFISSSPYAYVMNNPISFMDPDGRDIRETSTGWTFTGNDISLLSGYMGSGGSYSNLTSQLGGFGGNFGSGGISNFWSSFNGGSTFGGVRTNTNNTFSWWTNSAMPANQFSYQAGQKQENLQGIEWHSKKINESGNDNSNWAKAALGFMAMDIAVPDPTDAAWPKWAGYAVVGAVAGGYLYYEKMEREIEGIRKRNLLPQGFLYQLEATRSGLYPNVRGGTTYLNAGDVWKYGETTTNNRYTDSKLRAQGLIMNPIFHGNQMEIKIQEKIMIYGHFFINGSLPAGNKIFR